MNNEIVNEIIKEANSKDWEVVNISKISGIEYVVISKRSSKRSLKLEYHVNNFTNGGFFNGSYDLTSEQAKKELFKRCKW